MSLNHLSMAFAGTDPGVTPASIVRQLVVACSPSELTETSLRRRPAEERAAA